MLNECCCFKLRSGGFIIAGCGIVFYICTLILKVVDFITSLVAKDSTVELTLTTVILLFGYLVLGLLINIFLLWGVHKVRTYIIFLCTWLKYIFQNHSYFLVPWLIFVMVSIIGWAIKCIIVTLSNTMAGLVYLTFLLIPIYFWYAILSLFKEIRSEATSNNV